MKTSSDRLLSFIGSDKTAKEMLHLHAKLTKTPNGKANLTVSGKFDHLKIGPKPLTGVLDARVIPNTDFTQATVAANFEIADFHKIVTEVSEGNEGAAVATLIGSYSAVDKLFSVTALKISTPLGTAHAQGSVSTDSDFVVNRARLSVNNVPWQALKTFLPRAFESVDLSWHGRSGINP